LGQGAGEVDQGSLRVLHLWRHSQKTTPPTKKIFFIANYKICQAFELILVPELRSQKATSDLVVLARTAW